MKTVKNVMVGVVIGVILAGTVALATSSEIRTLTAEFCGINIFVDQKQIISTDATGKEVEPFIVDGTTYLPVRAIAEAFDKEVIWDNDTKTVRVFTKSEPISETEIEKSFEENYLKTGETLQDYKINSVEQVELNTWVVGFDVLPKLEYKTQWMAGNGEIDGDWIRNKGLFVYITKTPGLTKFRIIGTGL